MIGLRVRARRPRARASGPSRRGEHAKFGLSTAEILQAAEILEGRRA